VGMNSTFCMVESSLLSPQAQQMVWDVGPSYRGHLSLTEQFWRHFERLHHFSYSFAASYSYFWIHRCCYYWFWPMLLCKRPFPCTFAECKHNLAKQSMSFQKVCGIAAKKGVAQSTSDERFCINSKEFLK